MIKAVAQLIGAIISRKGFDSFTTADPFKLTGESLPVTVSSENQNDYYEMIGVPLDADADDIKTAFRKKVLEVSEESKYREHYENPTIFLPQAFASVPHVRVRCATRLVKGNESNR